MTAVSITIHIFKGLCQVGLGILALNQYKNKKSIGWIFIGIAFLLEFYEILFLNNIFPSYIHKILLAIQAFLFIMGIILLVIYYRKK